MLLAGVALAGANRLQEGNDSGILYALEAQDLNLEGTELVVLSACETALGQIDYGEGVSGLVRALRTSGARNVMVTLRPVGDQAAATFMQRFYFYWLKQTRSDPAAALRDAQREQAAPMLSKTMIPPPRPRSAHRPSPRPKSLPPHAARPRASARKTASRSTASAPSCRTSPT